MNSIQRNMLHDFFAKSPCFVKDSGEYTNAFEARYCSDKNKPVLIIGRDFIDIRREEFEEIPRPMRAIMKRMLQENKSIEELCQEEKNTGVLRQ